MIFNNGIGREVILQRGKVVTDELFLTVNEMRADGSDFDRARRLDVALDRKHAVMMHDALGKFLAEQPAPVTASAATDKPAPTLPPHKAAEVIAVTFMEDFCSIVCAVIGEDKRDALHKEITEYYDNTATGDPIVDILKKILGPGVVLVRK